MKFRGRIITLEDKAHIKKHIESLRSTVYHLLPEAMQEKILHEKIRTNLEQVNEDLNYLLSKEGSM